MGRESILSVLASKKLIPFKTFTILLFALTGCLEKKEGGSTGINKPPADPTALSISADSDTEITLSWTSGGGTTTGYVIAYQNSATAPSDCRSGNIIPATSISGTSHTISSLTTVTTYSARVCAVNNNPLPDVSDGVTESVTTLQSTPPDPTGLSATASSNTAIALNWTSGGGFTAGFIIAYQTGATAPADCTSGTVIPSSSITGTAHSVTGLSGQTTYAFRVCAENSNPTPYVSNGVTTSIATLQDPPPDPAGLSSSASSNTAIALSWTSGGGTTAGYIIAYQTGATAPADCTSGTVIGSSSITGTAHTVTGLSGQTTYAFRVCAENSNPTPDVSSGVTTSIATLQDPPPDPAGLSSSAASNTSIALSWTSGGGTTAGYRIAYQTGATAPANCSSGTTIASSSITGTAHTVTGLSGQTTYAFRVCAENSNPTPDVSSGVTTSIATLQDPPPDPTGLTASAASNTSIALSWSSGGGTTAGYRIAYQTGATAPANCSSGTTIASSSITGTAHTVGSLSADTQYAFRVCAENSNPTPDVSSGATASATTLENPPPNPSGLSASAASNTSISLSWTSGGGSTAGYIIAYQSGATAPADCTAGTVIGSSSITGTAHTVGSLSADTQYSFRVCAENGNPTPDVSSGITASATTLEDPPPNPSGLSASAASNTSISLSWTSGGGSTAGYIIAYQTGATAPADCTAGTVIGSSSITGTAHTVGSLTADTQYSFRVCAENGNPTPDVSSGVTASATTLENPPPDPNSLVGAAASDTSVNLSWISSGGTTAGYIIAYQTGATAPADCTAGTVIGSSSITGAAHTVTGLTANTQYSFRVCAENSNPTPDVSSGVTTTVTTLQAAPPNPSGFTATASSTTVIGLNWTSGGGSTTDYRISYTTGGTAPADCASGTTIAEGSITGTSHSVTGLTADTQYSFRVCAINGNPTPDVSSGVTASATTLQVAPPDPTGLGATPQSNGTSMDLSWTSGGGSTTDYRISYTTGTSAPASCSAGTTISESSVSGTTHTVTGLTAGQMYAFRVCAINGNSTPDVSSGTTTSNATWALSSSWTRRRKITFDNSSFAENLDNFPVLVVLNGSRVDYNQTQNSGQDLRFVDADTTTELTYEIETWDESGTSYVWVKIPRIDSSSSTDYVWMYYGNSGASAPVFGDQAWDSNYEAVWHLHENPATATSDSSSNTNSGTAAGGVSTSSSGRIGSGYGLNGTTGIVNVASHATLDISSNATIEGWFQLTSNFNSSSTTTQTLMAKYLSGDENFGIALVGTDFNRAEVSDGSLMLKVENDPGTAQRFYVWTTQTSWTAGQWYHFAVIIDVSNNANSLIYIDGTDVTDATTVVETGSDSSLSYSNAYSFGAGVLDQLGGGTGYTNGIIDEFRISNTSRSSNWIGAQYQSMRDNSYVSFSAEETPN